MSVPAAKAPPEPRMMSTRTSWSASARSQASTSASYMSHVSALRASGRFKVTTATDSLMSQATLLDGIVVLDATQVMAGPYCAMLLADMGARVIKVEPPAGDSTRSMAGARGNDSPAFNAVNRGKQGIVLDLASTTRAAPSSRASPARPDIVIENYRPGVMAKLGLDYDALRTDNPRLIYASISGHGQTGPMGPQGRIRSDRARPLRLDVGDRLADQWPGQGGRADHRPRRGALCGDWHPRRAAPSREHREPDSTSTRRSSMPALRCRPGKSPYLARPAKCRRRSGPRIG